MNTYLRKAKKINRKIPTTAISSGRYFWRQRTAFSIGTLFLFVASLNYFESGIKNSFYAISSPISVSLMSVSNKAAQLSTSFFTFDALKKENINLAEEKQRLISLVAGLQSSLASYQEYERAKKTALADSFELIEANTVGLDSSRDFLTINKGSEHGLSINMPVISSNKELIGRVSEVYGTFSRVTLISHPKSVLDVKIQQRDASQKPIYGVVRGKGNFSAYLDLVSTQDQIQENDVLVTSALDDALPKNLLVGNIISKDQNDLKPFQTANVKLFFNITSLENLFIIIGARD